MSRNSNEFMELADWKKFGTSGFRGFCLLNKEEIENIKIDMDDSEFLIIACTAYDKNIDGMYKNIKIKKIPEMLLSKCEFGKDNYNLKIINPPEYEEELEDEE